MNSSWVKLKPNQTAALVPVIDGPYPFTLPEVGWGGLRIEWEGTGLTVQVRFLKDGKTLATAPATLQTNDKQVTQDLAASTTPTTQDER